VKGKTQYTRIFCLAGDDTEARSSGFAELIKCHGQMRQATRALRGVRDFGYTARS
jgi:hypothetical protein